MAAATPYAVDPAAALRLWELSEVLVGETIGVWALGVSGESGG